MEGSLYSHKITLAFVAIALLGTPSRAAAQQEMLPNYGIEVRLGPYRPVLSADPAVSAVRNVVFQDTRSWYKAHPLLFSVEFDYYPWTDFGLLGFYARGGFWRQSAKARLCRDTSNVIVQCNATTILTSSVGVDDTSINLIPASLGVVYRYDLLRRNFDLPLLFSAKGGFDYNVWWSSLGDGPAQINGKDAQGGTLGVSGAIQVAVALDALRDTAPQYGTREAKQNNYFFVEYSVAYAPGLFQKRPRLDFTDTTLLTLGLSIDMR